MDCPLGRECKLLSGNQKHLGSDHSRRRSRKDRYRQSPGKSKEQNPYNATGSGEENTTDHLLPENRRHSPAAGNHCRSGIVDEKDYQAPLIAFNEVTAPYGTVSTLTLPDSSKVWLNAGSTLKYPTAFTSNIREVEMSGEAYFEVHADKEHPFIVSTGNLKVTATGTAFNVCSFAKAKEEVITLVTGKVNVSHENNIRHLLPGQQLNYQKASKSMEVTDIDTYQYISWKDGILAFRDDPLKTIFDRLEQVYRVRFILKDPSINQFTYRATFKGETLDEILDYMGMSIPITFRTTETKQEGNDSVSVRTIEVYKN